MNPGGLSPRSILEMLARLLEQRLDAARSGPDPIGARLALLPKRVHELGPREGVTPDGLSPEYVRLAAELNAASVVVPTASAELERLLGSMEQVVAMSTVHERALVRLLQTPPVPTPPVPPPPVPTSPVPTSPVTTS